MTSNETMMEILVDTIANAIAEFNPTLAAMFRTRPFHRKAMAEAFAGGFKDRNHPVAVSVLESTADLVAMGL